MKRSILIIIWGYVVEIMLCAALYAICWLIWQRGEIPMFIVSTATEWAQLTGTLFAASVAAWLTFVNVRATAFGDYLDSKHAVGAYSRAFSAAMLVQFAATGVIIAAKGTNDAVLGHIALFMLIYASVSILSLVRNASGLVVLYGVYRRSVREAESSRGQPRHETKL